MQLRRPIAALMTALALFGGGATLTACEAAGQDQNDGTTDSDEDAPNTETNEESDESQDNPPDISDESGGAEEDQGDDSQDPD